MAMSRSFGGTSLTTSPSTAISPALISSSPAIIRSVVDLPQPEGPTSTTNSLSAMSRSIPRTASVSSYFLTILRSVTCAMYSTLRRAGGEAGNVIVHQEGIDEERRRSAEQRAGHNLPPVEHIAPDQRRDDADRKHELIRRGQECKRIEELRPADREGEDGRGDQSGQRDRDEDLEQDLAVVRAVHHGGLIELLRDRSEVPDHDPGAERYRQRRIDNQQHPPFVDELD